MGIQFAKAGFGGGGKQKGGGSKQQQQNPTQQASLEPALRLSDIRDGQIWLSDLPHERDIPLLKSKGITHVLNVTHLPESTSEVRINFESRLCFSSTDAHLFVSILTLFFHHYFCLSSLVVLDTDFCFFQSIQISEHTHHRPRPCSDQRSLPRGSQIPWYLCVGPSFIRAFVLGLTNINPWKDEAIDGSPQGAVLVHCEAGVSRSATIVISYFMYKYEMTLPEAYKSVLAKRPVIRPNFGEYTPANASLPLKIDLSPLYHGFECMFV